MRVPNFVFCPQKAVRRWLFRHPNVAFVVCELRGHHDWHYARERAGAIPMRLCTLCPQVQLKVGERWVGA